MYFFQSTIAKGLLNLYGGLYQQENVTDPRFLQLFRNQTFSSGFQASSFFTPPFDVSSCSQFPNSTLTKFATACQTNSSCLNIRSIGGLVQSNDAQASWSWADILASQNRFVFNGIVLDVSAWKSVESTAFKSNHPIDETVQFILSNRIADASFALSKDPTVKRAAISCLSKLYGVGVLEKITLGCAFSNAFSGIALVGVINWRLSLTP